MHRVGGPDGFSTAKIGSWKLLGLQEVAPRGLLAWNNVCYCRRHPKGVGFLRATLSDRKSDVSSLTQVSNASDRVSSKRKS